MAGDRGIVEVVFAKGKLDVVSLHETPVAITSISCDASGDVWGVGENGWVVHRRDRVWSATQFDSDISFKKVFVNSKAVWILGLSRPSEIESGEFLQIQGILFRSIDQGASWQEKTPASANGLSDMIFFGDQGLLVGLKGAIYSSRDGGDTWNSVKSPTTNDLYSVCGINQREFIILGDSLTVLRHK